MHRRVNHNRVGILRLKTLDRVLTAMRRAVIHHPKHPIGMTIRRLLHHLIDQAAKRGNPCFGCTAAKHQAAQNIPGRQILDGATLGWQRMRAWILVFSSLLMTKSLFPSGWPCQRPAYKSKIAAALGPKWASRGKIQ